MSDSGAMFVVAVTCVLACGCATAKSETPVGVSHSAYTAKPAYLTAPVSPRGHLQTRRGNNAPLHADAPPVAEEPAEAEPQAEANVEVGAEENGPAAPVQRGGSLTVAPTDSAPPVNRQAEAPNPWQPTISAPEQTPNNPNP